VILAAVAVLAGALAAPPRRALLDAWDAYVTSFVSPDGRTIDAEAGAITTSEGQAYGMLRAAWADDAGTFARLRTWTRDNLQAGDPVALPAWKWGARPDGSWGVLDPNSASDADQLLAYAWLVAAERWDRPALRDDARALLARIWRDQVAEVGPYRVLLPGTWAREGGTVRLNPSYFLPFAWRAFALADPERPWSALLDDGYALLASTAGPAGLHPDWAWIDASTGAPVAPSDPKLGDFGFEAFRLVWALGADALWYEEPRARALLEAMDVLPRTYRAERRLPAVLSTAGEARVPWSYPGMYGALLPGWAVSAPREARLLYRRELAPRRAAKAWGRPTDYYAMNWIWFGLALWSGLAVPPERAR
jgi:endoglucanase